MLPTDSGQKRVLDRLTRLESEYRSAEKRELRFSILAIWVGLPILLLLVALVTAEVLIPRLGWLAYAIACVVVLAVLFTVPAMTAGFVKGERRPVKGAFNQAFPVDKPEERRLCLDLLEDHFEEFSIARIVLGRPAKIAPDAFTQLLADLDPVEPGHFELQCDVSLLDRKTVYMLRHYGAVLEALASGQIKARNGQQKHFVEVHARRSNPISEPEKVWRDYRDTVDWQKRIGAMDVEMLRDYGRAYMQLDRRSAYVWRRVDLLDPPPDK